MSRLREGEREKSQAASQPFAPQITISGVRHFFFLRDRYFLSTAGGRRSGDFCLRRPLLLRLVLTGGVYSSLDELDELDELPLLEPELEPLSDPSSDPLPEPLHASPPASSSS